METLRHKTNTLTCMGIALLAGAMNAHAADYAGSYKGTITRQVPVTIVDNGQHVIILGTSTGTNRSTGDKDYFDGGSIVVNDYIDMVNGNGTHQGYWTVSKDGEQVTNILRGTVTTVMAADGKTPITTIEGTVEGRYGTNLYGTIVPLGVYRVKFTSPTEYVSEWEVTGFK